MEFLKAADLLARPELVPQLHFLHLHAATTQEVSELFAAKPRLRMIWTGQLEKLSGEWVAYSRSNIEGTMMSHPCPAKCGRKWFNDERWVQ